MESSKHHSFTLWFHSDELNGHMVFHEGVSFDHILQKMLAFDELGFLCFLTCDTCSTHEDIDNSEDLLK